ncbi:MAG: DMT family transporter [Clostridia bacterium]|nr:DMT family transporter [Clostridia bacterium]
MLYLIAAILSSSLVSVVMRLSKTRIKNEMSLLAVNYLTCFVIAWAYMGFGNMLPQGAGNAWTVIGLGAVTGAMYLLGFVYLQWNVGKNGVVLSSTFMKLGLLVPILLSVVFFGEVPTWMQAAGFAIAVAAVLLINGAKKKTAANARWALIMLLLFCGMSDAMCKVYKVLGPAQYEAQFLLYTFLFASLLCLVPMVKKREKPGGKELFWGVLLGVPNFFAARFLLSSLSHLQAFIVYPTFSVATMVILTLAGVIFFKEKLARREWIGLGLILGALVLLNV